MNICSTAPCTAACSNTPAGACCRGQQKIPPAARHAASEVFSALVEALLWDAEHGAADDEGGSQNCGPSASSSQESYCSKQVAVSKPLPGHSAGNNDPRFCESTCSRVLCMCAICHGLGCAAIKGQGGVQSWLADLPVGGRFDASACGPGTGTVAPASSACSHRPAPICCRQKAFKCCTDASTAGLARLK